MKQLLCSFLIFCCLIVLSPAVAQQSLLQSGPMVGYAEMREVMLWVQTRQAARVKIAYYEQSKPAQRMFTKEKNTVADNGYVAKLVADKVLPGKKYSYELYINNQKVQVNYPLEFQSQPLWKWRTDPPAFTFAIGSCTYVNEPVFDRPGKPYGGDYGIFSAIRQQKPDFMLWLGDNSYLREADWNTRTGIIHRYTHTRSLPEMQPLLGSVHHYAIWDDHDFGPNDSDRTFWNKDITEKVFKDFWANPNYNLTGQGGITGTFTWNDAQFFLLDNRYFRSPNNLQIGKREIIGETQLRWLIESMASSDAAFKFVVIGGQVLNTAQVYENYATYAEEREQLLQAINAAGIKGVIFLTGDRHHTELSKLERPGTYPLYDLTCSPLTAGVANPGNEVNNLRVSGTLLTQNNFATMQISGPASNRSLKITLFNSKGAELWQKEIKANELQ